jgi:glycosyltransferase involved in cell wall biosynthesis
MDRASRSQVPKSGLVSVIIPHYEADDYLPKAVKSVMVQEYRPIEIVIIDSSNSSVAKSLSENHAEILYEYREPAGVAAARNQAIEVSSGEYIALLDADDYWLPGKLNTVIPELSDADVVYSDMYISRDDEREYYETKQFENHIHFFRSDLEIPSRTVVACRYVFNDWMFNESLKAREDPNLWTKLLSKHNFKYVPKPTGVKRIRKGSLTTDQLKHTKALLKSLEDIINTFPELEKYEKQKRLTYLARHTRNHFEAGNNRKAAQLSLKCIISGEYTLTLLAVLGCSLLPNGNLIFAKLADMR